MAGFAITLLSQYGNNPNWVTISLGSLMYLCSILVRIKSLQMDLEICWNRRWVVLAVLVYLVIFNWLEYGLHNETGRAGFNSGVLAVLLSYLSTLALRIGRKEESSNAKWIASVYYLLAAAFLFRLVYFAMNSEQVALMKGGVSAKLIAIIALLSSVIGHFGYVGLALDRFKRRELMAEAERVRIEERNHLGGQIAQLDRSRALGEMAASLGHELNQPLTATLTNAQVAKRGLHGGQFNNDQLTEFLDKIIQNTQRASQIIERIRSFIRPSQGASEPVNLKLVVDEVNELVSDEAKSRQVHIELAPYPLPLLVTGDPIQLSQIVLNVVRNAIEAVSQVAWREIRITYDRVDNRAILRIHDNGPGLSAEALHQIGLPFFTTKPTGLGMGFSISSSIAAQHGGSLTIANADGGGAVVELNLPALPMAPS